MLVVKASSEIISMTTAVVSRAKHQKDKELYFYTNLETLMAEKGLSIAELSEQTGVAQSTIRSLIRGRLKRLDSLSTGKLAQFFNCKLDDLYVMKWE
jgi:DNA-binding Xre family transcriptional regulator